MDLQERVRQLAAADGDLSAVRAGLDRALRLSLAHDVAAISTVDPATMLWTSCFVSGLPPGGEAEREQILYGLEFAGDDINGYTELANSGQLVGRLHQATGGDLSRARRWGLLLAQLDISDEMRVVLASRGMVWGSLTLYRRMPRPAFSDRDENIVRSALPGMADLFRLAMLRAAIQAPSGLEHPPGMMVISPAGEVTAVSQAARDWLDMIDDRDRIPSAVRSVAAAAAAATGWRTPPSPSPRAAG